MEKLIFVCTGNTCRSPMAEKLAMDIINKNGLNIKILSRGLNVYDVTSANQKAICVLNRLGLDLLDHIPMQFDVHEVTRKTMVLTMTNNHREYLKGKYPAIINNIYTLKEYIGETGDIMDPYGSSLEEYSQCALELLRVINIIFGIKTIN